MAPPSLKAWLRTFLRHEVDKALEWKRNSSIKSGNLAHDDADEQLHEDDGSNFRSHVPKLAHGKDTVQLVEVLSIQDDYAEVRVSDGQTKVKARLSREVLSQLETDAGDALSIDTKGDVIRLKSVVVISTSLGRPDGFVWLDVMGLDYCYHLRKLCGTPSPIHEDKHVQLSIEEIAELRRDALSMDESPQAAQSDFCSDGISAAGHQHVRPGSSSRRLTDSEMDHNDRRGDDADVTMGESDTPNAPLGRESLQIDHGDLFTEVSSGTQQIHSKLQVSVTMPLSGKMENNDTVSLAKMRRKAPRLEDDGFEIQEGVNLSRPTEPRTDKAAVKSADDTFRFTKDSREKVIELLSKKRPLDLSMKAPETSLPKASPDCIEDTPTRPNKSPKVKQRSVQDEGTHFASVECLDCSAQATSPTMVAVNSTRREIHKSDFDRAASTSAPGTRSGSQDHKDERQRAKQIQREIVVPRSSDEGTNRSLPVKSGERAVARLSPEKEVSQARLSSASALTNNSERYRASDLASNVIYGHRRIPRSQLKLLEDASSWMPSLPGRRFPHPNVPIELLREWTRSSTREQTPERWVAEQKPSGPESVDGAIKVITDAPSDARRDTEDDDMSGDSDSSSDSEEEITWASSPVVQRAGRTPPDSSPICQPARGTQMSDLEIAAPKALPMRTSPKRMQHASDHTPLQPVRKHSPLSTTEINQSRRHEFMNNDIKRNQSPPTARRRDRARRDEPPGAFEEFYDSFTTLQPGGHWARPRDTIDRERVDVLRWQF